MPQEFTWYNQVAGYNRILELTDKEQCKCVYTRERGQQGVFTMCLALFCGLHKHFANREIRTQLLASVHVSIKCQIWDFQKQAVPVPGSSPALTVLTTFTHGCARDTPGVWGEA